MKIIENKNTDKFLKTRFLSGAFLQSSIWESFLKKQDKRFWKISVEDKDNVIGSCLVYENKLPFGKSYLYSPKGPIISLDIQEKEKVFHLLLSKIRDLTVETRNQEEIFFSLEVDGVKLEKDFIKIDNIQPADTLVLNLEKDIKKLLREMHPKTRYNIGLAQRKGIKIKISKKEKDIKKFLEVLKKTADRNKINLHSDKYYKLLWKTLLETDSGELYFAKIDNKVVSANMIIKFGDTVTYLHGGSDYKYRKYMATYLLQWEVIKKAKEKGFLFYDFWGIAPKDNKNSKWSGFTRFKKGFNGMEINNMGTYNFIYQKQIYFVYKIIKKLKNFI